MHWPWELVPPTAPTSWWDWPVNWIVDDSWSGSWRPKCFASWICCCGESIFKLAVLDEDDGIFCSFEFHHDEHLTVRWGIAWTGFVKNFSWESLDVCQFFFFWIWCQSQKILNCKQVTLAQFEISYSWKTQKLMSKFHKIM